MKNIFKVFAFAALLISLASCQEKFEPYKPTDPASGPQVYFKDGASKSVNLDLDGNSFVVELGRVETSEATTVNLNVSGDGSKYFSVPSSVSFASGSSTAKIEIGYSLETLGYDNTQTVNIAIADESLTTVYGSSTIAVSGVILSPWTSIGYATIQEDYWYEGTFTCEVLQNDLDSRLYRLVNPFGQGDKPELTILKAGETLSGVTVEEGWVKYTDMDLEFYPTYSDEVFLVHPYRFSSKASAANFSVSKVIAWQENGLPGQIKLSGMYYMFNTGGWDKLAQPTVTITFPGYVVKDYAVSVEYSGIFSDVVSNVNYAVANTVFGEDGASADIESVALAVVEGSDYEAAAEAIASGEIEVVTVTEGGEVNVPMPEDAKNGVYTVVAVSFGDGEAQKYGYSSFLYYGGAKASDLKSGDYDINGSSFTVEPSGKPYEYYVSSIGGMEDGLYFYANFDPDKSTLSLTGVIYGEEEYGNQFGAPYGYYDDAHTLLYAYASYASEESAGDDECVFNVDPVSHKIVSIANDYAVEIRKYAAGYPFVKNAFEAKAGDSVTFAEEEEAVEAASNALVNCLQLNSGFGTVGVASYHNVPLSIAK